MTPEIKSSKHEKGQSLVELGLALIVLLIIFAGLVDLGRAIFYYLAMRDAAQEGLMYGVVYPNNCMQIEDRVLGSLADPNIRVQVSIGRQNEGSINSAVYDLVACNLQHACRKCHGHPGSDVHVMQITVSNPNFPLGMPFIGAFLGTQTISLRATIQGTIVRPITCKACP